MLQINMNISEMTNQEIDALFWGQVKKVFAEDFCPDIRLNADGAELNPAGFVYLRKQILILGQIQQAGAILH